MRVAAALLVATAASVLLRTGALDSGYWIDEAIAVGIASHDPADIPALLLQDGSPPLYYLLLHGWMALAGMGEAATRSLSLAFAALAVPAAWWAAGAVGGRRAAAVAAAIAAACPALMVYAQEARMYTLVAVLSLVATAAFAGGRRKTLVAALVLLLYTHTWGVFLAAALIGFSHDRLVVGGAVAVLYLPWAPSLVVQALHTGAPWSQRPSVLYLLPALAAAAAVARRPREDPVRLLTQVTAAALALAWLASQVTPAWSPRYLLVLFGPALLALACVLARARPWVAAAPVALAAAWLLAGPPAAKSNARAVAASVAPSVRPGDLVLVMPVYRRPRSAWARAVQRRTREWRAALRGEPRLRFVSRTSNPDPARFRSTVRAEIYSLGS